MKLAAALAFAAGAVAIWVRLPGILLSVFSSRLRARGVEVTYRSARAGVASVALRDLKVRYAAPGGRGAVELTIPEAAIALDASALLRREVRIREARITDPDLEVDMKPGASASGGGAPFVPIQIDHLVVSGARFGQRYATRSGTAVSLEAGGARVAIASRDGRVVGEVAAGRATLAIGDAARYAADSVEGRVLLDPEGVTVERATVEGGTSRLAATGRWDRSGAFVWRVDGEAELHDVLPASRIKEELSGRGPVQGVVAGTTRGEMTALFEAHLPSATVFGWPLRDATARVAIGLLGLSVTATGVDPTGSKASGRVLYQRSGGGFSVDGAASLLCEDINRIHGLTLPLAGEIRADGNVSGRAGAWGARARLDTRRLAVRGIDVGAATGDLAYGSDGLTVRFDVPGGGRPSATGLVTTETGKHRAVVHLERFEGALADLLPMVGLRRGSLSASVRGTATVALGDTQGSDVSMTLAAAPGEMPISGSLVLQDLAPVAADLHVGSDVDATLQGGRELTVRAASAAALLKAIGAISGTFSGPAMPELPFQAGPVDAEGVLEVPPAKPFAFDGDVRARSVAAYGIACAEASSHLQVAPGRIDVSRFASSCGVAGDLGIVQGHIAAAAIRFASTPLPAASPVGGTWDGSVDLASGALAVQARARLAGGGSGSFHLSGSTTIASGDVVLTQVTLPYGSGVLSATFPVALSPDGPTVGGTFDLQSADLAAIHGEVETRDRQVRIRGRDGSGALDLEGLVELSPDVPFDLHVRASEFPIPELLVRRVIPGEVSETVDLPGAIEARISGEVRATGTRSAASLSGRLSGGKLRYAGREIISRASGRAGLEGGGVVLDDVILQGPEVDLRTDVRSDGTHLSGVLGAGLLSVFLPGTDASGKAHVDYAPGARQVEARLEDVELARPDWPTSLHQVRGPLTYRDGSLSVPDLRGELGDGPFLLEGTMSPDGGDLIMRLFPVTIPSRQTWVPGLHGALGGRLELHRRRSSRLELAGELRLSGASYERDIDPAAFLGRREGKVPSGSAHTIDVEVGLEDPVVVKNNLMSCGITGMLRLEGDLLAPAVAADLTTVAESKLVLRGQRYELERGELTARDLLGGDWTTQVRAHTTIKGYDVTLDLHGGGRKPIDVAFASEPALPAEDIQALLLFGTTADKLPPGMLQAMSGALVLSPLLKEVESRGQKLLGVDRVRIEPYVSEVDGSTTARVTLEKDLGKNLSMMYSGSAGPSREDVVVIEYRGLPGGRKLAATRELDGTYTIELGREITFGGP